MSTKAWYESRTLWLNVIAIAVFGIGLLIEQAAVFNFSPQLIAAFGIVVGVFNYILRLDTAAPVAGTPAARRRDLVQTDRYFDGYEEGRRVEAEQATLATERAAGARAEEAETMPHGIYRSITQQLTRQDGDDR